MNTNAKVNNYYDLLTIGLGNGNKGWQSFVDHFKEKYNVLNTAGFVFDPEIQLDYTYQQLQAELNIATLPVYMDADAEALDKKLGGFQVNMGSIPTQKHRYGLDTRILREKMLMIQNFGSAAITEDAKNAILNLLYDSTDKLIAGNHNALTHQRMQVVSTGQFTINSTNNTRGITGITFDFGTTTLTANATTARWWTSTTHNASTEGSASDPLGEIKNQLRAYRASGYPAMQVEMSQQLFDDLLTHSKVLAKIGYVSYPLVGGDSAAVAYAQNLTDEAAKNIMEKIIGAPIVVNDSKASVESYNSTAKALVSTNIDNFSTTNIAYVPQGNIGTIKSVQQLVFADDPTCRCAWFDGGRTLLTQRYDAKTRTTYVESEMAMLTVPNMPQYMSHKTVTA